MAKNKSPKILTKKHLARQERERRQTRIIISIAISIVAIVFLAPMFYSLYNQYSPNFRNAVTVNNESRNLHQFQVRVRVARQNLINQYQQYQQFAQMFGMDPNSDPQLSQSLNQITQELDTPSTIGGQIIDEMVNDLLIRQYAKANGIVVSAAEIEKAAQDGLRYYPNGTPTPTLTPTGVVYATLDATQLALITPTPTATPTQVPTLAPTSTHQPTATPDTKGTPTPIPTVAPSPTPYTLKGYQDKYKTTLKSYSSMGLNDIEFRDIFFESGLYRDRVQAKITADIAHKKEMVWIRDILVADEATAKNVITQFKGGTDFAQLASTTSIDTTSQAKGGDLGWLGQDATIVPAEVIKTAFSMNIGGLSQPIKTTSGYHVIQVLGHEVRPLTDAEYQSAVTNAFNAWLQLQRTKSKVVINNAWTTLVPTSPTLAQAQANQLQTATAYIKTSQAKPVTK
jgi:peptidyl-prolyl cis-trans isomerase D